MYYYKYCINSKEYASRERIYKDQEAEFRVISVVSLLILNKSKINVISTKSFKNKIQTQRKYPH